MAPLATTTVSRTPAAVTIRGYRLDKVVGTGGMGQVYRAEQLSLGRTVAVKVLSADLAQDPAFVSRFEKEAAALATLHHPHVVSIVERGETDAGIPFLVMEFVEGPSLREVMRSPLFDAPAALRIFGEVARAIDYAHRHNVIHRDLKPENILLDEPAGGIAKVSDFGLAAFLQDEPSHFNLTQTHMAMGTLAYMAPEQRLDAKSADGRADIYSLGVLLYEMLTGSTPVGTFEPPSRLRPGLDPRLDGVIARCLRPDPTDRFTSVGQLLEQLDPLLPQAISTTAPIQHRSDRLLKKLRSGVRVVVTTIGTLIVALAAAVLLLTWPRLTQEPPPRPNPGELLGGTGLGEVRPLSVQGRMADAGRTRRASLHSPGPDNVPLLVTGRAVRQEKNRVIFDVTREAPAAGRVTLDTLEGPAESLSWSAVVQTGSVVEDDALAQVKRLLEGPPAPARAALLLQGDPGRFVALVMSENDRTATIDWALGERRGRMQVPVGVSAGSPVRLEISIDPEGALRAFLGEDQNRRAIGEPLILGERWQGMFGRLPQAALGCIEGTCSFEDPAFVSVRPAPAPVQTVRPPPPVEPTRQAQPRANTRRTRRR